ncbi:cytochrome P450 [Nonomuraea sp. NPDC050643]|uniref:cytochrome P450 n=1 Tax=Nonomuraea sp. NPDC050643 TaxID=3155660 RepID=UPI0033EC8C6F
MTGLPEIPMPRECPYRLPAGYAALRAEGPMTRVRLRDGTPVWAVTGQAWARALLADPRLSSDALHPNHPQLSRPEGAPRRDPELKRAALTFVEMDDPLHAAHRRMVIPYFSVRRVRALRPHIEAVADDLVSRIHAAGPPADLMAALAVPLPALTLCAVLGVPHADREFFRAHLVWPMLEHPASGPSFRAVRELLAELLPAKNGDDDVLGGLARRVAAGELTERQALEMCSMLIIAGHETTANTLALGVLTLLAHPGQLAALRADPAAMPGAVEELLRYLTVADTVPRVALADIEIGDRLIRAGEGVVLLLAAANRDAAAFAGSERFDIGRRAGGHLTFGHGVHQCLGHVLARAELEIALTTLLARLPGLRLAVPADRLPVKPALSLQGVTRLPITWEP